MMSGAPATRATTTPTTTTNTNSRRVPLDKRKRTETSCDKCKSRKQKCRKEPGQDACRYCIVHKIECQTTQPRKKRLYGSVEGLGNRLALLEALVKGLLPEADISNLEDMRRVGSSLGIPLPDTSNGDNAEYCSASSTETEDPLSLLPDQQGQVQYIGPSSSFSFHVKLRTLVGQGAIREFVLFGRNAADQEPIEGDTDPHTLSTPGATSSVQSSPADRRVSATETPSFELLISAYFDQINPDFPVLHEASFREAYEQWMISPVQADPAWLCSFLCVLLLARRVARISFPEDQERLWWKRVQTLLPVVIFTSSLTAVQALLLAAIHLHNTNHRDACWNLTGTAVRIAFAIGLHQDKVSTMQTPLARELRKRLWWTLYAFEQMQVSSYDRPSAIEHAGFKIGCPNERIIDMAGYCPPDYCKWFNKLLVHLGSACRAPKVAKSSASEESYVGPLSPAAGVMRDLDRWKESLPVHLKLDAVESSPPAFQRPLLLLHAKYHYIVLFLCRAALLSRATIFSKEGKDSSNVALTSMADSCVASGQALSHIILHLESLGKFDAITWWDVWYTLACSSILVLDIVCTTKRGDQGLSQSRILLSQLADLAQRHRRNPHMPGTIEKWASLVPELRSMVDNINAHASPPPAIPKVEPRVEPSLPRPLVPPHQEPMTYPFHASTTNSGAYMFSDTTPGRFYPETEVPNGPSANFGNRTFDRNAQMTFMDFTINNIQDWNWGDLGSLLGNEGVPPQGG